MMLDVEQEQICLAVQGLRVHTLIDTTTKQVNNFIMVSPAAIRVAIAVSKPFTGTPASSHCQPHQGCNPHWCDGRGRAQWEDRHQGGTTSTRWIRQLELMRDVDLAIW